MSHGSVRPAVSAAMHAAGAVFPTTWLEDHRAGPRGDLLQHNRQSESGTDDWERMEARRMAGRRACTARQLEQGLRAGEL